MNQTVQPLQDYINGEFSTPTVNRGVWLENPNTREKLQEQMATDEANIEKALVSAQNAYESGVWSEMGVDERCGYLAEFSTAIDKRKDEISRLESLTTGVPISLTTMFQIILTGAWHLANEQLKSGWTLSTHEGFTGRAVEVHRKPLGVGLCLVPWNAPAPMAVHKVANSLAAGCPTILKPTE